MHPCLQINELLDAIVEELYGSDLIALATVCHKLSSPALDQIWRSIDSIESLLACLPSEIVIREENDEVGNKLVRLCILYSCY